MTAFGPTQRAEMIVLGLEQELPAGLELRVETYDKDYRVLRPRYENLLDPLSLLPELRWDRVQIAPQSARARGVEVLLSRKSASAWNGWLNYAWSTVEDREGGVDTRRSWDQKHAFGGGLSWTSDPWIATLAATWHSGWPTTSVRLAEPIDTPPEVLVGSRNDIRLQDFLSIDARLSRTLPAQAWRARRVARGYEPDESKQSLLRRVQRARWSATRTLQGRGSLAAHPAVDRCSLAVLAQHCQRFFIEPKQRSSGRLGLPTPVRRVAALESIGAGPG